MGDSVGELQANRWTEFFLVSQRMRKTWLSTPGEPLLGYVSRLLIGHGIDLAPAESLGTLRPK